MIKDSQFIMTFQLALIGIILVGGLFLVWKSQTRMEEKLERLLTNRDTMMHCPMPPTTHSNDGFEPVDTAVADEMMKHLFGGDMMFGACAAPSTSKPEVQVMEEEAAVPEPSETSEVLSKNKLRTMTLEKLKKLCEEKNLSTEGTKNQLIDRILE